MIPPDAQDDELRVLAASVARARAQREAGEAVPGADIFSWLASWGKDDERPAPGASR